MKIIKKIKINYKTLIHFIATVAFLLLIVFTWKVISITPNAKFLDIDFEKNTVANYGTLISGILSFLAILFVIYNIKEQREIIEKENLKQKNSTIEDYINRLKLLNNLISNILIIIERHGKSMKDYYSLELKHPTQPNQTYFPVNKSFNRILEMDFSLNYLVFQHFFKEDVDWEKLFLNIHSYVEFYSECLIEHREKYQNHIKDKVIRHQEINEMCKNFLSLCSKQIDIYREANKKKYLNEQWVIICNEFIPAYYKYSEECHTQQVATNFKHLSDYFFHTFLINAMELRNTIGYDQYYSKELVESASSIRKKIYEVAMYSTQYAENIKYYFDEYFDEESESFINLKKIVEKINSKVQSIS